MTKNEGLREFVAVVESGGFTAAAKVLNVSTSFISRQVTQLEKRLEIRLLHRTTRTVRLTEMGKIYYERSREILDQLETLDSEMSDLQEKPKGLVKITAAGEYAERYVAPTVARFVTKYPDVSVQLDATMQVVDIIEEGFDIAIRASALTDSSLVARKIEKRRIMICASPGYLNQHGRPKKPEDLRSHNCLLFPDMAWRFKYPDRIQEVKVRGNWRSNNGRVLVAAAREGHGLVRFSEYYVKDYIQSGELEVVLQDFEVDDVATWIIYPNRHHLPTRVRFLVEYLLEQLPGKTTE
ncbi:MAG: LysR family transcriptional regulator [Proteobacteria bacterium]|nr:LysR family transcriptional regulator [Pseudomonadota bacterium]NOG60361.1 LysR family transcriptional regulator [Pseudomonadota bacterium]